MELVNFCADPKMQNLVEFHLLASEMIHADEETGPPHYTFTYALRKNNA